ncbi:hypothetical protein J2808_004509 [Pseudarthrobacter sulfonivorans]|nr:hypothetical protein [Pseudarthrobacter sulfonivorans]
MNEAGKATNVSNVDFTVPPDGEWPTNLVVIVNTVCGEGNESFPIDNNGTHMYASGNSVRETPDY